MLWGMDGSLDVSIMPCIQLFITIVVDNLKQTTKQSKEEGGGGGGGGGERERNKQPNTLFL